MRRYLACGRAGVEPKFHNVLPDDPVDYVLSLNLHRRHLTTSQWSMCAGKAKGLKDKFAEEAKERMRQGGKTAGKGRPQQGKVKRTDPNDQGQARDKLGERFGASGKSVETAERVIEHGKPRSG